MPPKLFPYSNWNPFLEFCHILSSENQVKLGNPRLTKILKQAVACIQGLNMYLQSFQNATNEAKGEVHARAYDLQLNLQKLVPEIMKMAEDGHIEGTYLSQALLQAMRENSIKAISNAYYRF